MTDEQIAATVFTGIVCSAGVVVVLKILYDIFTRGSLPHLCFKCKHSIPMKDGDFSDAKCSKHVNYDRGYLVSGDRNLLLKSMCSCISKRDYTDHCEYFKRKQ